MENGESGEFASERGGIVTARGTGNGLIIRLDGRVDAKDLRDALKDFMMSRRSFLAGNEVSLEWVGGRPPDEVVEELSNDLQREFDVTVRSSRLRDSSSRESPKSETARFEGGKSDSGRIEVSEVDEIGIDAKSVRRLKVADVSKRATSLFDGIEALTAGEGNAATDRMTLSADSSLWDDPDARIIYSTLRSGQKVESDHSLVILGDVNSGAEVIAGGDIVVLGTLRGVAHAGAYDETGGGRIIFALNLQPTQLRIGMVISRGSSETQRVAEVARVEGSLIVVEPYQARSAVSRQGARKRSSER